MKRILVFVLLLLPFLGLAQRHHFGVLGGYKFSDGPVASFNYYYIMANSVLIGPSVEVGTAPSYNGGTVVYGAPGINGNFIIPFGRVFVYPGVTARYRIGENHTGLEYGFVFGAAYEMSEKLSLNIESGYRVYTVKHGYLYAGSPPITTSGSVIPLLAGIKFKL